MYSLTAASAPPDAWLDDVRRWYYGGDAPAADQERQNKPTGVASAPASPALAGRTCCEHCRQLSGPVPR